MEINDPLWIFYEFVLPTDAPITRIITSALPIYNINRRNETHINSVSIFTGHNKYQL